MKIFKNAWFDRFARKHKIADAALIDAVRRAENGQIDADLGGGVVKQRVARSGQGKSGGYRTIIFYRKGQRAFFIYGFAKNERDNINDDEKSAFKKAARHVLELSEDHLFKLIERGQFIEVRQDAEEIPE